MSVSSNGGHMIALNDNLPGKNTKYAVERAFKPSKSFGCVTGTSLRYSGTQILIPMHTVNAHSTDHL